MKLNKQYYVGVVLGILLTLLIYSSFFLFHGRIIIIEHAKTHSNIPRKAKNIFYSSQYKDYYWEAEMDIEDFDLFVNDMGGYSIEFDLESPIRVGRYTILKAFKNQSKQTWIELKYLLPENENNSSCFHFVKHGRIACDTGQKLIVYDNDNHRIYVISRAIFHTSKGTCLLYNSEFYLETLTKEKRAY
jgi:hypothetical protein